MTGSEHMEFPEDQDQDDHLRHQRADNEAVAGAGGNRGVPASDIDRESDSRAEKKEIEHGGAGGAEIVWRIHSRTLSMAVTMTCGMLCALMPPIAMYFGFLFVLLMAPTAIFLDKLGQCPGAMRLLDAVSRGRLVSMMAALALYPSLPAASTLSLLRHPAWVVGISAPPGLLAAFAFALLCCVQCVMAFVLVMESIPLTTVYGVARRLAARLPSVIAGRMGEWIDTAERHNQERRNLS